MKTFYLGLLLMIATALSHASIVLNDTHGRSTPFESLQGKWVFINYWASWCHSCIDEIPEFNTFYNQHKNDAVALFGVNFDALPLQEQKKLIQQLHISYPNLLQDPANALQLGDIQGVPVTFIFNPKGQLVKTLYGGQSAKTLERVLARYKASS